MSGVAGLAGERQPAVAGTFYPGSATVLEKAVRSYLAEGRGAPGGAPRAVIAPHAGYDYSGPVAGSAFRALAAVGERLGRVVLIGPAHFRAVAGLALPPFGSLGTPLGAVEVDQGGAALALELPQVQVDELAHRREHSLEVELPFLRVVAPGARVVPLLVGFAGPEEVAEVIERLWVGEDTVVVISSDLSHYLDYRAARRTDERTAALIESLAVPLPADAACGARAIDGLLLVAKRRGLRCVRLDLRSSGDTAGGHDRVVGYGAFAFVAGDD